MSTAQTTLPFYDDILCCIQKNVRGSIHKWVTKWHHSINS